MSAQFVAGAHFSQPRPYRPLTTHVVELTVRQHPEFGVATPEAKEKLRRPVDPPPIVQLNVSSHQDPSKEFLVNPFLFMTATLVYADEQENGTYKPADGSDIIGQSVSSLHRLKDINNKDGGFFVFGDISCRKLGSFRLKFNLFDFDKNNSQVAFVSSIITKPFKVVGQKDFKGLSESTHLSRTFSDQGVRLRLRKEPRSITGTKRAHDQAAQESAPVIHGSMLGGPVHDRYGGHYGYETPVQKRARSGSDYTNYGSASSHHSTTAMSQYPFPNSGSSWPSQSQQPFQADQSPYGVAPHLQPQTGPNPNYQRYAQPDAYSTDSGNFRTYGTMTTYQQNQVYGQPSQAYQPRASRDALQSMSALPSATTMTSSGLNAIHSQNYHGPMSQTAGSGSYLGSGTLQSQHSHHDQESQHASGQYGAQSLPIRSSNQSYDAYSDSIHGQSAQPELKYAQNSYQAPSNMYSNGRTAAALSDTALPLGNAMLISSFAPSRTGLQQCVYDDSNGQGIDGFKQELSSYPTPNQTSPGS